MLVWGVEKKTGIATEAVIGVVFAASLAVGALITPREELEEVLFGSMRPLGLLEFIVGCSAAAGVITVVLVRRHHLALALFSPDIAAASGINLSGLSLEFLLLFSLTILLSLKFLGALLAGALLMIPAATGRRLATSLSSFLAFSAVAGRNRSNHRPGTFFWISRDRGQRASGSPGFCHYFCVCFIHP